MQPIMAVWSGEQDLSSTAIIRDLYTSGFALGGTSIAQNQLGPYIQQAIDQVRQITIAKKF
jgi:hypothetical protein